MAACLEIFGLCFLHRKPSRVAGFSGFVDWYGLENDASSELDLAGLTVGSYGGDVAEVAGGRARNVGRREDGVVERVEGFEAKLQKGGLGEVEVLQDGSV
jgi:hypothetical protein